MSAAAFRNRVIGAIVVILLLVVPHQSARCEVGADLNPPAGPSSSMPSLHKFFAIGDGPDPFSGLWQVLGPATPGRVVLNPLGSANGDGPASVLADPATGLILVAWSKNSPNGFDVVVSRFVDGAWTGPQTIAGDLTVSEKDPNLVLGPDGSVHLFYWIDGAAPAVYYTHAPGDLSSWSTPILASEVGQPACRPAGVFHNGVLHVAFELHDFGFNNTPREVVLSRFDGTAFTPEVVAVTNNLGDVFPAVHSHTGRIWVDWVDSESNGAGEVAWTRIDSQGHWEPIHYEPFADATEREFLVRGAVKLKAIR